MPRWIFWTPQDDTPRSITRLRLDAALYAPTPQRLLGQLGRTPLKGERLPALGKVLADRGTAWNTLTVAYWYGEYDRQVEVASDTAVWYHSGIPTIPLRWVLIRDPLRQFESQALLYTEQEATPSFILECFVQRWQVRKSPLKKPARIWASRLSGNGQTRQFPAPCLAWLGMYSFVTLAVQQLFSTGQIYRRCAAWYPKPQATFSDTIASVRRELWSHAYFSISNKDVDMVKIPRPLVDRFIDSLCYAA